MVSNLIEASMNALTIVAGNSQLTHRAIFKANRSSFAQDQHQLLESLSFSETFISRNNCSDIQTLHRHLGIFFLFVNIPFVL